MVRQPGLLRTCMVRSCAYPRWLKLDVFAADEEMNRDDKMMESAMLSCILGVMLKVHYSSLSYVSYCCCTMAMVVYP